VYVGSVCPYVMVGDDAVTVSVALLTTWLRAVALLEVKPLPVAGVYAAVMLCVPAANALEEYVAVPPLSVTGDPAALPSTLNCTVPVGTTVPLACVTVAVMVTDWP
jgi:hypothetical protein